MLNNDHYIKILLINKKEKKGTKKHYIPH